MGNIKKAMKVFLLLAVSFLFFCQAGYAAGEDEVLNRARKLVEEKNYHQALEAYEKLSAWLRRDPGLIIEWARVCTYADMHTQAIALFEEVRRSFPQRGNEILRELADQYKWNGQLKEALGVYMQVLKETADPAVSLGFIEALAWDKQYAQALSELDRFLVKKPDDVRALLLKAEILSWRDRLEQSDALFLRVLQIEPQNLQAKNGRARLCVWQGYHRKGIKMYQAILKAYPDDPAALEGLAYAYYWDGQNRRCVQTLDRLLKIYPGRKAAVELNQKIKNSQNVSINQSNRYAHDSNGLSILSDNAHLRYTLGQDTRFGTGYGWQSLRKPGNSPVRVNRGGVDLGRRFNEYFEANSYVYATRFNAKRFTPVTTNTWVTFKPDDIWRFDVSYDRQTVDDIQAIHNRILINSGSFSFDIKPNRFWFFSAKYQRSRYSDDNNQNTAFARLEYRINQAPYIKLYYNYYYSDFSEALDHGYFNPRSIASNVLGVYASKDIFPRLFFETQLSCGYETQKPKSDHPVYFGAMGLNYRLSDNWIIGLRGEYFNARDTNSEKEYSNRSAWLNLTYKFGATPVQAAQPAQSNRPTGQ